jgi:hypothetical protein
MRNSLWNGNLQGKPKYSEKTHHSTTLSTTNYTWPDPGIEPGPPQWEPPNSFMCVMYLYSYKILLQGLLWERMVSLRLGRSSFRFRSEFLERKSHSMPLGTSICFMFSKLSNFLYFGSFSSCQKFGNIIYLVVKSFFCRFVTFNKRLLS